jgi:hypothetical protein
VREPRDKCLGGTDGSIATMRFPHNCADSNGPGRIRTCDLGIKSPSRLTDANGGKRKVLRECFAPFLRGPLWRLESSFHDLVGRRFLAQVSREVR